MENGKWRKGAGGRRGPSQTGCKGGKITALVNLSPHPTPMIICAMKKPAAIVFVGLALLAGGCALGIPISPLMFLLKNDPAPTLQGAPGDAPLPGPTATPEGLVDNNGATVLS